MEVEFTARFPKEFTKEEQKDIDDQAKALMLFDGDLTLQNARNKILEDDNQAYQYGPWVLNMDDVADYNLVDKDHVRVIKKNGVVIILAIDYDHFKTIKYMVTGSLPMHYSQYPVPPRMEVIQSKQPTTKKKK